MNAPMQYPVGAKVWDDYLPAFVRKMPMKRRLVVAALIVAAGVGIFLWIKRGK